MIFFRLLRFFFGSVDFTACNGFPERFINICALRKIPLRDLKCCNGVLSGNTTIRGYKEMRPAAKKSGMCMRIKRKRGLPFFTRANKKRAGFLAGFILLVLSVSLLSSVIWSIDVVGNEKISDEEILEIFEDLGVHIGAAKISLNVESILDTVLESTDRITWASLNIDGSSAIIEVRERLVPSRKIQDEAPCNVVASCDGQIEILEAFNGTAEIAVGDGVQRGDLLVSGVIENKDLSSSLCHADAYVVAMTEHKFIAEGMSTRTVKKITDEKTQYTLCFLWFKIPIGIHRAQPEEYTVYESSKWLCANGKKLPLGISRRQFIRLTETETSLSQEELFLDTAEQLMKASSEGLILTEATKQTIKTDIGDTAIHMEIMVNCRENISDTAEIEIGDISSPIIQEQSD